MAFLMTYALILYLLFFCPSLPSRCSHTKVKTSAAKLGFVGAGNNIRVNAICPGLVETGMTSFLFEHARRKGTEGKIGHLTPAHRAGSAREVANVAIFLASDEASMVNGQALAVDCGLSALLPFIPGTKL